MKSSCIAHPENEPLIIIRRWQIEACDGNRAAAALLSFFEYWHNIKLEISARNRRANDIAEMHGEARIQDEGLWQFHTTEDLENGVMIFKKDALADGLKILAEKGYISSSRNPNPKYAFDKTRYFLFHPEAVNKWLEKRSTENRVSYAENRSRSAENRSRSAENRRAITETTSETTNREVKENEIKDVGRNDFSEQKSPAPASRLSASLLDKDSLEAWLSELQADEAYKGLAVRMLYAKMLRWCEVNGKKPSKRRFINWLNREDQPLSAVSKFTPEKLEKAKTDLARYIAGGARGLAREVANQYGLELPAEFREAARA